MKIGILTSGGDAPGMNAFISKFVSLMEEKNEIVAFKHGYQGLIDGTVLNLTKEVVSNIAHLGGSFIRNSRCLEFKTKKGLKKGLTNLKLNGIDVLVVLGGDGTLKGAKELVKNNVKVIYIPTTIDNDLVYTEQTLGFDSAVNAAVDAIDKIKQTMISSGRIFIAETMGRHSPDIATNCALATDANIVLTKPEHCNVKEIVLKLKEEISKGQEGISIVVKENLVDVFDLAKNIQNQIDVEARACKIGYVQRGTSPSVIDRILARNFASQTAQLIEKKKINKALGVIKNKIISKNILEI